MPGIYKFCWGYQVSVGRKGAVCVFVVVVYDVHVDRIPRVRNILSKYLMWTQNSVFEGEIDRHSLAELVELLENAIDRNYDRVRIYVRLKGNMEIRTVGLDKSTFCVI